MWVRGKRKGREGIRVGGMLGGRGDKGRRTNEEEEEEDSDDDEEEEKDE